MSLKRYDLHVHTYNSKCSNLKPEQVLRIAKTRRLDGVAITDHNTIKGALKTFQLNKDKDFEIVIGEEVMTDKGEVLVYYVKKQISPGKFERVITEAKKQGAIAVLAHPYDIGRKNSKLTSNDMKMLDGIECLNGRCLFSSANTKAKKTAMKFGLAQTGGSDAHFDYELGKCYTLFTSGLKQAVRLQKTTTGGRKRSSIIARIFSGILKRLK
jgi:predicted metal-dependent phosphoesterase TrpH